MYKFLLKGLLRDRSRTLFPILIISAGVMLTVLMYAWLNGFLVSIVNENARLNSGHVKVVTKPYAELINEKPYDLAILNVDKIVDNLVDKYPEMNWQPRIYFGGLLDKPDKKGETVSQGDFIGYGIDLFSNQNEIELMQLEMALQSGNLPQSKDEILISETIFERLNLQLNESVSIIGSTMYGAMTVRNYRVSGTIKFGVVVLDNGAVVMDISSARELLDMENAASEVLGFLKDREYNEAATYHISEEFNQEYFSETDEFYPVMLPLRQQGDLNFLLTTSESRLGMIVFTFIFLMSLVLWNSGLMNGIRRYGEIGVRLAMGENKLHIYFSMIVEAGMIGIAGSIIGTLLGLGFAWYMQVKGIDVSNLMKESTIIMSTHMRANITPVCFYIGFIPGFLASITGAVISGVGIYKRKTSQLFKELEQ